MLKTVLQETEALILFPDYGGALLPCLRLKDSLSFKSNEVGTEETGC